MPVTVCVLKILKSNHRSLRPKTAIVPVEALLYRGQAALDRARALRDELRSRGSTDPDALHELYDLLDLARAE